MTLFEAHVQLALDAQREHPERYTDIHVGLVPRDYVLKAAREAEGVLPEVHLLHGGVTFFHEKGGFQTWGEDYEAGEHEPGHILVRVPTSLTRKWGTRLAFREVEGYVEATLNAFMLDWEIDFRLADYMVIDRDITTWGNGNQSITTRYC